MSSNIPVPDESVDLTMAQPSSERSDLPLLDPNRSSGAREGGSPSVSTSSTIPFGISAKSSTTSSTRWRVERIPTHGGLKLADSPPGYKLPGQRVLQGVSSGVTNSRSNRASDARYYARHLIRHERNGARYGRWSR